MANICVYADAEAKQPIGIIIPHEINLRHALEAKSVAVESTTHLSDLCANKAVQDLVLKECNAIGKKNGFKPMEILEAVILTADEWTPESGLVTAAQKVQRSKVAKKFEKEIKVRFHFFKYFSAHVDDGLFVIDTRPPMPPSDPSYSLVHSLFLGPLSPSTYCTIDLYVLVVA